MQLFFPADVPSMIQGRLCRQSRLIMTLALLAMLFPCVVIPAYAMWMIKPVIWIRFPILTFASFMAMWLCGRTMGPFSPANWLVRIAPDGLWINIRSYLNSDFAPARTVIFLPYEEIASAGEYVVKRAERDHRGMTSWTERYLDVRLTNSAPEEVIHEVSEERRRTVESSYLGGLIRSKSRNNHVPVSMPTDQVLRLAWGGRYDFITPTLARALRDLEPRLKVTEVLVNDVRNVKQLSPDDVDGLILELAQQGDSFGAVKLLRERRGFNLTDAKHFVDELTAKI